MAHFTLLSGSVASTFVIGILVYLLVVFIRCFVKYQRKKKFFDNLPGYSVAEKHWLRGHLSLYIKNNSIDLNGLQALVTRFPKYFRIWFGFSRPSIQLVHPDTIKIMLKTSEPKPLGIGGPYRPALPWLGEGLLLAGGAKWARSRRLLTPAFHFEILKPYQTIYNTCTDKLLGLIDIYAETGESFELFQLISNCTLDIILQCAFSYQTDCQKDRDQHPYCRAISNVANLIGVRNRSILYLMDFTWNMSKPGRIFNKDCDYIHDVADKVIESRKQVLAAGIQEKKKYLDFLDILLSAKDETGTGLSQAEIRAEVDTFMFEGHDTTTSGISWILYELAKNQSYQKLCQQEVDKVLRDSNDFVTWENLHQFDILTQCIKEGMRIHPPVPIVSRQSTKEMTIEDITFPKDTAFSVNIYGLHHNPTVWKDHMTYDPSRFSKDRDLVLDSFAFIPFSAGPRNCIGQNFAMNEEKTVIARILERYTLELDRNHIVEEKIALVMRAKNGIHCIAKRRK
ncbi:CYP4B1 [Mytilus coruscus]|uniref:CYP4B1 n=1 Tax=Mytilus coruscus TaxID=42192 RepID=A0A6J8A920_MYTCO|nr:CYP4B1 [Mytilus coruscus]